MNDFIHKERITLGSLSGIVMKKSLTFDAPETQKEKAASNKPSVLETVLNTKLSQRSTLQKQQYEATVQRPTMRTAPAGLGALDTTLGGLSAAPDSPSVLHSSWVSRVDPRTLHVHSLTGASYVDLTSSPTRFNDEVRRRALEHIQGVEDEFKEKAQLEFAARVEIEKVELLKKLWPAEIDINRSKAGK